MNKAILIGNLTKDPELSTIPSGVSVCKFSIAVNRIFADAEGNKATDFFNIVVWRKVGENCAKFLKKGSKVCVVGQIQNRSYDDKDGNKRYVTEIIADEVEFLSRAGEGSGAPMGAGDMTPVSDDNLPF
jgi:single-strand DNA-binding protein